MPNYQDGKIYKLWSPEGDDIYIGSTTQTLAQRKAKHKISFTEGRPFTSKVLFEKYTDVRIELIEEYPCDKKSKLIAREGHYIRTLDCVNKVIPGRTEKEYKEDNKEHIRDVSKEWRENNKEHYKEYMKEWRENNKEHIKQYRENNKEYRKEYLNNNQEKIKEQCKEYGKEYRENNKQKIKQHASEKIICECGCETRQDNLTKHKRTTRHIKLMQNM